MRDRRFSNKLPRKLTRSVAVMSAFVFVAGCEGTASRFANLDLDLRDNAGGLDTSAAARQATVSRPRPDARGVISYPSYQVAVAERGDTVQSLASRVGVSAPELARFNGLQNSDTLNPGEIVALPRNVQAPSAAGIIQAPIATQPRDITAIATTALDEATPQNTTQQTTSTITRAVPSRRIDGPEPIRHQVKEGETAFSIARLHNVSVRSLNDWNGLGPDLKVRTGQYLLIPVVDQQVPQAAPAPELEPAPGNGTRSVISEPPSGAQPLPAPEPPAQPKPEPEPVRASKLQPPVVGKVIKPYKRGQNEGIDIEAAAGTSVRAAEDGEVAAITRDTDQVPILVLRHADKLLTVYANISDISVKKGDKIKRGQQIAKVGNASPSFLHFEVRQGFESTDPVPFLK